MFLRRKVGYVIVRHSFHVYRPESSPRPPTHSFRPFLSEMKPGRIPQQSCADWKKSAKTDGADPLGSVNEFRDDDQQWRLDYDTESRAPSARALLGLLGVARHYCGVRFGRDVDIRVRLGLVSALSVTFLPLNSSSRGCTRARGLFKNSRATQRSPVQT